MTTHERSVLATDEVMSARIASAPTMYSEVDPSSERTLENQVLEAAREVAYAYAETRDGMGLLSTLLQRVRRLDARERRHRVKVYVEEFERISSGSQPFYTRAPDPLRDFRVGDAILFSEARDAQYTGRRVRTVVTCIANPLPDLAVYGLRLDQCEANKPAEVIFR